MNAKSKTIYCWGCGCVIAVPLDVYSFEHTCGVCHSKTVYPIPLQPLVPTPPPTEGISKEQIRMQWVAEQEGVKKLSAELTALQAQLAEAKAEITLMKHEREGLAKGIIVAQAAIVCGIEGEAVHALYGAANPAFDSLTPFAELEKIAGTTIGNEIEKLKHALPGKGEGEGEDDDRILGW